jgi:hypothetical protein
MVPEISEMEDFTHILCEILDECNIRTYMKLDQEKLSSLSERVETLHRFLTVAN